MRPRCYEPMRLWYYQTCSFWCSWSVFRLILRPLWQLLGLLGRLLEGSWELLGTPSAYKPFIFWKWMFYLGGSTIFKTCSSKGREARTVRNHEDIRRWDYESMRVRGYESMEVRALRLWYYETMKLWNFETMSITWWAARGFAPPLTES